MRTVDQLRKFGITGIQTNCAINNVTIYTGYNQEGKEVDIVLREPDNLITVDKVNYAKSGIWMPSAAIMCHECHGNVFHGVDHYIDNAGKYQFKDRVIDMNSDNWLAATSIRMMVEDQGVTTCDKCGQAVFVDEGLAMEHNLSIKLKELGYDASMDQTGGMNSAVCIKATPGDAHYMIAYSWDGDDMFYISKYDHEGEWMDDVTLPSVKTIEEIVEQIKTLEDVKMLEAN